MSTLKDLGGVRALRQNQKYKIPHYTNVKFVEIICPIILNKKDNKEYVDIIVHNVDGHKWKDRWSHASISMFLQSEMTLLKE